MNNLNNKSGGHELDFCIFNGEAGESLMISLWRANNLSKNLGCLGSLWSTTWLDVTHSQNGRLHFLTSESNWCSAFSGTWWFHLAHLHKIYTLGSFYCIRNFRTFNYLSRYSSSFLTLSPPHLNSYIVLPCITVTDNYLYPCVMF